MCAGAGCEPATVRHAPPTTVTFLILTLRLNILDCVGWFDIWTCNVIVFPLKIPDEDLHSLAIRCGLVFPVALLSPKLFQHHLVVYVKEMGSMMDLVAVKWLMFLLAWVFGVVERLLPWNFQQVPQTDLLLSLWSVVFIGHHRNTSTKCLPSYQPGVRDLGEELASPSTHGRGARTRAL